MNAVLARTQARRLLAEVALDGVPKRTVVRATPILTDFVQTHREDIARHWKPSTQKRNLGACKRETAAHLRRDPSCRIVPADVLRWRDGLAGEKEVTFNRTFPVLASLLKCAEQLRLRRKGSNPCRGMSRYKRPLCKRYLIPFEYRRHPCCARRRAHSRLSARHARVIAPVMRSGTLWSPRRPRSSGHEAAVAAAMVHGQRRETGSREHAFERYARSRVRGS